MEAEPSGCATAEAQLDLDAIGTAPPSTGDDAETCLSSRLQETLCSVDMGEIEDKNLVTLLWMFRDVLSFLFKVTWSPDNEILNGRSCVFVVPDKFATANGETVSL